jgi:peptide/nickel transport system permease protein
MRYIRRRLLHGLFLLVGISLLSFAFSELAPGDYFEQMRLNPQISRDAVARLRSKYGMDRPLPVRYYVWVRSVASGQFGYSFAYNRPVSSLLWVRARNTLILTGTTVLLAWMIAVPLGVWSASRKGGLADRIIAGSTSLLLAIPDLALALGLLLLAVRTRYFPTGGMVSLGFAELNFCSKFKDVAFHLFLPVSALVLGTLPVLIRHVRAAMLQTLESPFMRTAHAYGIPRQRRLFRYALPAAANPMISLFGFSVGTMLSASLLIEVIMSWPGLGPLLLEAILARDLYVLIDAVMLSSIFWIAGNIFADAMLYASDPRLRVE